MPPTATSAIPEAASMAPWRSPRIWVPGLALLALWVDLVCQLGQTWSTNEQYSYGWFVPFLSLGLLWRDWGTRPAPGQAAVPPWMALAGIACGLLLLPARILHEVNPDWPLANWLLALLVVLVTLLAVFLVGGWPWVRHFAFPIVFILVAVPWPYRIEHGITQGLMRIVASIGVEILGLLNIPALQRGNLIEIDTGVLGVDEACSGIRSLQTTIMGALFLGEQYRLSVARRAGLLGAGVAIAFALNVLRAVLLSWNATVSGMGAVDKWHDPAGLGIVVVCFLCLWGVATWLTRGRPSQPPAPQDASICPTLLPPRWIAYSITVWVGAVFAGNAYWYRPKPSSVTTATRWTIALPTNAPTFASIEIAPRSLELLQYDESVTGTWKPEPNRQWDVYWFRWNPRSIAHVLHARVHRPDRCLPAAGLQLIQDAGLAEFYAGDLALPFRQYVYEHEGNRLHVFFCLWEDGAANQSGMWSMYGERIRAALVGRKLLGQQTLQVIIRGHDTLADAATELRAKLPHIIAIENGL